MIEVHDLNPSSTSAPVALLLPGMGYSAQAPLLYWSADALIEAGWHVYAVAWKPPADVLEHARIFVEHALALAYASIGEPPRLVIGKSLGAFALPSCVGAGIPGVWLTPVLADPDIVGALREASEQHLAVGGDADAAWQPEAVGETKAALVTLAGMNHSLELVPGDWRASIAAQAEVVERIAAHAAAIR